MSGLLPEDIISLRVSLWFAKSHKSRHTFLANNFHLGNVGPVGHPRYYVSHGKKDVETENNPMPEAKDEEDLAEDQHDSIQDTDVNEEKNVQKDPFLHGFLHRAALVLRGKNLLLHYSALSSNSACIIAYSPCVAYWAIMAALDNNDNNCLKAD